MHLVGIKVTVTCRRRGLRVTKQLADYRKPKRCTGADRGEAVMQVMNAYTRAHGCSRDRGLWLLQIRPRLEYRRKLPLLRDAQLSTRNDVRIFPHTRERLQHDERRR